MELSGHETRCIFDRYDRYDIVDEADLANAEKPGGYLEEQVKQPVVSINQGGKGC